MKKILVALLCITVLTGCGGNKDDNQSNNNTTTENTSDNNQTEISSWYDRFEAELKNKNINYTSKTSTDATSIGGVEGYHYETNEGSIDVYRFDNDEELNKIVESGKVSIEGSNKNVEVKDNMVIVSDGLSSNVLDIFKGMK